MAQVAVTTTESQVAASTASEPVIVATSETAIVATTTEEQVAVTTSEISVSATVAEEQVVAQVAEPDEIIVAQLLGIGQDGLSAYQIAVAKGFSGTQEEWLASLKGPPGTVENATFFGLLDVTPTPKVDSWVPSYGETTEKLQLKDPNALITITDGGNF